MISPNTKNQLNYLQMVSLSAMFHDWALHEEIDAGYEKKLLLWAQELLILALEVGPNWEAPPFPEGQAPTRTTFLGMKAELQYGPV